VQARIIVTRIAFRTCSKAARPVTCGLPSSSRPPYLHAYWRVRQYGCRSMSSRSASLLQERHPAQKLKRAMGSILSLRIQESNTHVVVIKREYLSLDRPFCNFL